MLQSMSEVEECYFSIIGGFEITRLFRGHFKDIGRTLLQVMERTCTGHADDL
jgi:hypothetical protein